MASFFFWEFKISRIIKPQTKIATTRSWHESALSKANTKKLHDGSPVQSFNTLISSLAMVVLNDAKVPAIAKIPSFTIITTPNTTQKKALELVGLDIMAQKKYQ